MAQSSTKTGTQQGTTLLSDEIKSEVRRIVPSLTNDRYKGQSGKVGVLGGCSETPGAAYFAAYAALQIGCDLSHVFCTKQAATIIKIYSPELLVHSCLHEGDELSQSLSVEQRAKLVSEAANELEAWFSRLDCLVLGPGLGRDSLLLDTTEEVIRRCRAANLPIVLDGDALFLVARNPSLVNGYKSCVLTPDLNEFRRLAATLGVSLHGPHNERSKKVLEVTTALGGPTVVSKGPTDVLADLRNVLVCAPVAAPKRCAHQGHILAGSIATFVAWALAFEQAAAATPDLVMPEVNPMMLAAYGGCITTRTAGTYAFAKKHRSMVAGDMLDSLWQAVQMHFENLSSGGEATDNTHT